MSNASPLYFSFRHMTHRDEADDLANRWGPANSVYPQMVAPTMPSTGSGNDYMTAFAFLVILRSLKLSKRTISPQ